MFLHRCIQMRVSNPPTSGTMGCPAPNDPFIVSSCAALLLPALAHTYALFCTEVTAVAAAGKDGMLNPLDRQIILCCHASARPCPAEHSASQSASTTLPPPPPCDHRKGGVGPSLMPGRMGAINLECHNQSHRWACSAVFGQYIQMCL